MRIPRPKLHRRYCNNIYYSLQAKAEQTEKSAKMADEQAEQLERGSKHQGAEGGGLQMAEGQGLQWEAKRIG